MKEKDYQEIQALNEIYQKHKINIRIIDNKFLSGNNDYRAVELSINKKSLILFVDDEYKDLKVNNPLLILCLILRALEDYKYADDYLVWCKNNAFEAGNSQIREYYMNLGNIYREVGKIIGKIDSQISDYDFELNAGAARKLRETN